MPAKTAKKSGKKNRCWPGYEPVPGKKPYSKGSCRKKKSAKNSASNSPRKRAS